ncbi:hypothetical protein TNCV_4374631 [Trichonephila clavipes]|uniref:Uncharacterized protein n=1 Tax=Trichonephila clavipes TaxID=2585209 RepID=A0A8X6R9J0_TRICX|nr:hypothetical protein TNCV_4374631 [Trichonephila clavipes]
MNGDWTWGHETVPLRVEGDIEDVSSELEIWVKKADVQSVHRVYRGRLERDMEWMSAHVASSWCPLKNKQHAHEQLSPVVPSLRLDTPIP